MVWHQVIVQQHMLIELDRGLGFRGCHNVYAPAPPAGHLRPGDQEACGAAAGVSSLRCSIFEHC